MNEVTKLYKNARVKPINFAEQGAIDFTNTIEIDGKRYLDFTPEKQLELIKWLAKFDDFYVLKDFEFNKYRSLCGLVASEYIDTFEEMLANLILNIWDELTKAQKAQIKEILE